MIVLYHCNTSLASYKVRLYLAEKNIFWNEVLIDLRRQENITSDYRTINPKGLVPALKDAYGNIHVGSTNIMEFLEKLYPQPPLLPADVKSQHEIHQICMDHEALHDPAIRTLSYYAVFLNPEKRTQLDVNQIIKIAKNHPSPERGDFLIRAVTGKLSQKEIDESRTAVIRALNQMEQLLEKSLSEYLIGSQYSMADVVCTASAFRITEIGMENEIIKLKHVARWWQNMKNRPSFKVAILDRVKI